MALNALMSSLRQWLHPRHERAGGRRWVLLGLALLLAWGVFGGSQGLFALALGQREKALLRREIQDLAQKNKLLEQQVDLLVRKPESYERTARERLLLMRPGEIVYRFH